MQKLQPFISNLRQQSALSLVLVAIVSNALYSFWYQIPFVATLLIGLPVSTEPLSQTVYFGMTVSGLLNMFVATVGLALLIPKKSAYAGFIVGGIVALFFSMNAYMSSFISSPSMLPPLSFIALNFASLLVFYAIPGTLLGYFRKE